ncbi:MAG: cation:proton antiporter [Planctomycetaceae bacterium]|nr:cation:proton antiporter [Planctomycetaceae bacterium]
MEMWILVSDVVILLGACLLIGGVFSRLGQSPLVGYLLAGMVLGGPGSLHAIQSEHEIEAISELGVSLLLFSLGLEFSIARLKKLGPTPLLGGILQVSLTLALTALAAVFLGFAVREAIALGAMVSLSSTAIVLRILMENSELETPYGGNSLAVLLIQDIAVVPLAILISLLGGGQGIGGLLWNAANILMVACLLIIALYVLLNHVASRALGMLTLERNRELTTILSVATGLGSAWAANLAGISPALGAFVAGMFLGASPFATQIRADISPLRIVLLTLFFGSAGMVADPVWVWEHILLVLSTTAGLLALKFLVLVGIFLFLGNLTSVALCTGICLAQVGEFAFVLGNLALRNEVISGETHNLLVSATIMSLFIGPVLVAQAPALTNLLTGRFLGSSNMLPGTEQQVGRKPDVVIVGFGPAGQFAGKVANKAELNVTVIDLNRNGVRKGMDMGFEGLVGDATQHEVLEHAHVAEAKVVVVTIPSLRMAIAVVDMIRSQAPQTHIVVRARYLRDIHELYAAGADIVFDDEEEIGHSIGQHLSSWILHQSGLSVVEESSRHAERMTD